MATKKSGKKASKAKKVVRGKTSSKAKKVVRGKTATKQVKGVASTAKKAIARASKNAAKESTKKIKAASKDATKKATTNINAASKKLDAELEKLHKDMQNLKAKGKTKKQLSEYNLFVGRQLKAGRTFAQAVRLWKRSQAATKTLKKKHVVKPALKKAVARKPVVSLKKAKRKPSKKKPIKKVVKKKLVKKKAKARNVKIKKVKRTIIRKKIVRRKPSISRRVVSVKTVRPIVLEKDVFSQEKLEALATKIAEKQASALRSIVGGSQKSFTRSTSTKVSTNADDEELSDEELALSLTSLYFKEIAQLGFKRGLELDAVINAYLYSLSRIKRKEIETKEIIEAIRKAGVSEKPF
jgi:histone H1/5